MEPKEVWEACQNGAGLVPLKNRAIIEISGPDRGPFLQGLFSQDVAKNFPAGAVTYGIFPNVKGRIIADAYVCHIDENRFLLDVEGFAADQLLKYLDTYLILLKAAIKKLEGYTRFSLLGPEKGKIFEKTFSQSSPPPNACKSLADGTGLAASIQRGNFRELQLWMNSRQESEVINSLKNQGAVPGNEGIYDVIQIELGVPKLGREMDETTFPQEVGLEETLNFQKGCFVGAEVLQRIFYQGHVNRALALFSTPVPLPRDAGILQGNTEVGKITTCVQSFRFSGLVALGLIKISALDEPLMASSNNQKIPLKLLEAF